MVLNDVSLQIKSGEFLGICGKSGSGKSTLANLMAGLLDGYDGEVFVGREDIRKVSRDWMGLMIMRKKFVPAYLFSFVVGFVFSELLDVHEAWIDILPKSLGFCVLYFVISYLLLCIGSGSKEGINIKITFIEDGAERFVKMIQPDSEDGIWIPQDYE